MNINDFDYPFNPALIAQRPLSNRDRSRLLVLDREKGTTEHRRFFDIGEYLNSGDLLVLNNTRVVPHRLYGRKDKTGGEVELLLIKKVNNDVWEVMVNRRVKAGIKITFSPSCRCRIIETKGTYITVKFYYDGGWDNILSEIGSMPIPSYIKRRSGNEDREWYQTVYASEDGAIAAPTAGLHFTKELLDSLRDKGVLITGLTLHVGTGTFKPVKAEWIEEHKMDYEWFDVNNDTVDLIHRAKKAGGKVVAVGSTSMRALEQSAMDGVLTPSRGETGLFIYPGFKFRIVDALVTNFHLPKSTLIMLVMAFAGRVNILKAYAEAVSLKYRFYSYGDAMLII
ncbi:MAG: tRNA preQ1(34) S-adenosylmethionine ribosyltransferase-isomerase QueA [Nitrospirae bacterium]|nr:tRNA preQ1(34) S-adenosylmethionine ribosyltransferase-isomerase QueA [Nitrospirota bacterium]